MAKKSFHRLNFWSQRLTNFRPGGRSKILGVLMTFVAHCSCNLEILGVLKTTFCLISRNIGGAIAPPAPPLPPALNLKCFKTFTYIHADVSFMHYKLLNPIDFYGSVLALAFFIENLAIFWDTVFLTLRPRVETAESK